MNLQVFNFFLFLIWFGVGVVFLIVGPMVNPKVFTQSGQHQLLGGAALLLSVWNLIRWWMIRSAVKQQRASRSGYTTQTNPLSRREPPKVVNPEFQFDDPPAPPPSQNGTPYQS